MVCIASIETDVSGHQRSENRSRHIPHLKVPDPGHPIGTPIFGCPELVSVIDRWLAPDHRYFKVEGDDGQRYILRHDVETRHWEVSSSTTEE